ncbi:MAG: FAD-dependent oxidoreductase, partial [Ktedonobacterales bacterium]
AYPEDLVLGWGARAFQVFQELAGQSESGVVMRDAIELLPARSPDPWWAPAVPNFRHATRDECLGRYADGYAFDAPVIDMSVYLDYLMRRFLDAGGTVSQRRLSGLDEAFAECPLVVNCAGLGARELLGDHELIPSRGQVVRIRATPYWQSILDHVILDDSDPDKVTYIVPRIHDIVLGATAIEGEESVDVDDETTNAILARCAALVPELADLARADILNIAVGLRPTRPAIRLEREQITPERAVIHNYGHGGAGVTLSWGCADDVARLAG